MIELQDNLIKLDSNSVITIVSTQYKNYSATSLLTPKAKIIDACVFSDTPLSEDILITRIKEIVEKFKDQSKIYNLSINAKCPIEQENISFLAYEIDCLIKKHNILFTISSGNHSVWSLHNNIEDVLDDDDTIIAAPAESVLALTVGAINRESDPSSITDKNELSPYSRIGPGFSGNEKPDLVAYSGNISEQNSSKFGAPAFSNDLDSLINVSGTSYSAPVVAGDLACILSGIPEQNDVLTAKTLILHGISPLYDYETLSEDEIAYYKNLYGNGLSDLNKALFSTENRVTFVCRGELDRLTKQRVKFFIPTILCNSCSTNTPAIVTVTCLTLPPVDRTKGTEYLGAYVNASLKKITQGGNLAVANPQKNIVGRKKWQPWQHFKKSFCSFNPGDYQVWLELSTRWDIDDEEKFPYVLAISIEDPAGKMEIYSGIQNEVPNRYQQLIKQPVQVRQRI